MEDSLLRGIHKVSVSANFNEELCSSKTIRLERSTLTADQSPAASILFKLRKFPRNHCYHQHKQKSGDAQDYYINSPILPRFVDQKSNRRAPTSYPSSTVTPQSLPTCHIPHKVGKAYLS